MALLITPATDDVRTPQLNIAEGGQQGIMQSPHLWASSSGYVRQKIIAVLVAAPIAMNYMDNAPQQKAALKSLIELMAQKIDGLNSTLTAEYDGPNVGHAGEKFVSPTKVSRAVSAPNYTWNDRYGMAITRYWTEYLRLLIGDPDLGVPGIVQSAAYRAARSPAITAEQQAMTVLFIEPDLTMTNVTNAWLCTNMMPMTGGDILGKKEMAGAGEVPEVNIEFTALTFIGSAVNTLSKNYLNTMKLGDLRPLDLKPAYEEITPDVKAAAQGLANQMSDAVRASRG